jgi:preprotein translocase subunit SecA
MSVFQKILKAGEGKRAKQLAELVGPINELSGEMAGLTDAELRAKTDVFKERLAEGETLDDILIEAYAVVREAASRVLGQRHYDVQLMGGMALHFGWIAEMKTGEGKTLVSTLPVYLNALAGNGVHVVTVNDYLATRDANWMGQLHRWLGLTVGRVGPDLPDFDQKREAYLCDVTYGTNTEFGFDYLRDNMARRREHMVQRGHPFAIVDEVDSILIDEARTPLIISGPAADVTKLYYQFASIARTLIRDEDYEVDEEKKTVIPTEAGIEKVERLLGVNNLYDAVATNYVHQLGQALRAKELFHRDKEYLVDAGVVKIVDEFTGRTLDGRRWSDGLHQAVEAKERVRIQEENHTWATVTLQNYFRLYEKLAGMTGTAETEAGEFGSTYKLPVVPIPTHRPSSRKDLPDLIYKTEAGKIVSIIEEVQGRNTLGQPILLGTASVEKSELISRELSKAGITHEVLNAKHHFREAEIVAQVRRHGRHQHGGSWCRRHLGRQPRRTRRARGPRSGRQGRGRVLSRTAGRRGSEVPRNVRGRRRRGASARRPLRTRIRAPRLPTHRQSAAWPFGASGRPRREPLLLVPRGRPPTTLRDGCRLVGDGSHDARGRADRGEDGLQGHRTCPEHRRGS